MCETPSRAASSAANDTAPGSSRLAHLVCCGAGGGSGAGVGGTGVLVPGSGVGTGSTGCFGFGVGVRRAMTSGASSTAMSRPAMPVSIFFRAVHGARTVRVRPSSSAGGGGGGGGGGATVSGGYSSS